MNEIGLRSGKMNAAWGAVSKIFLLFKETSFAATTFKLMTFY